MRVVFMGTPDFAVPSLVALNHAFDVVLTLTRPDTVRSRGKKLEPSPVKAEALKENIPVLETRRITPQVLDQIKGAKPDVICVAAFGAILPDAIFPIARLGCLNVHASLLPRWRGAAPIQRAILAGDERAGVSIMRIAHDLDAGAYCRQVSTVIGEKSDAVLTQELACLGACELVSAINDLDEGKATWTEQDASKVTLATKIKKQEMHLNPQDNAITNARKVQASSDAAPARMLLAGKGTRITKAHVSDKTIAAGTVRVEDDQLYLGCRNETSLEVLNLKSDGKKELETKVWLQGQHQLPTEWASLS